MLLKDLIKMFDSKKSRVFEEDLGLFEGELDLYNHELEFYGDGKELSRQRLTSYYITKWTDEIEYLRWRNETRRRGIKVYFLDGEFICLSDQTSRSTPKLTWASSKEVEKVENYLIECFGWKTKWEGSNLENETGLGLGYNHRLTSNLLDDISEKSNIVYLGGEKVEVLVSETYDYIKSRKPQFELFNLVKIKLENGNTKKIECHKLTVPWT